MKMNKCNSFITMLFGHSLLCQITNVWFTTLYNRLSANKANSVNNVHFLNLKDCFTPYQSAVSHSLEFYELPKITVSAKNLGLTMSKFAANHICVNDLFLSLYVYRFENNSSKLFLLCFLLVLFSLSFTQTHTHFS